MLGHSGDLIAGTAMPLTSDGSRNLVAVFESVWLSTSALSKFRSHDRLYGVLTNLQDERRRLGISLQLIDSVLQGDLATREEGRARPTAEHEHFERRRMGGRSGGCEGDHYSPPKSATSA